MKTRIRLGRYQDIFHIETLIQELIETAEIPLPPIQRPFIYNVLNYHLPRGEVMVAIAEEKLAGFSIMAVTPFLWNDESFLITGFVAMRSIYRNVGLQKDIIQAMAAHAHSHGTGLILRNIPGIPVGITSDELAEMGGIIDGGSALFLYSPAMEKADE